MSNQPTETLGLFSGRCGHRWIGAVEGSFACPVCGDHEGDHHLVSTDELPVQMDDYGSKWDDLAAKAKVISDANRADALAASSSSKRGGRK